MIIYVSQCCKNYQHQCQHFKCIHASFPPSFISEGNHQTIL
ncbi:hypothetical protein HMPREF1548_01134 [Clostridium sp. KLE 1755]|nr:hypothetical protein HMPREF1548_01134 [Clostridium sp. KLE 1755]